MEDGSGKELWMGQVKLDGWELKLAGTGGRGASFVKEEEGWVEVARSCGWCK